LDYKQFILLEYLDTPVKQTTLFGVIYDLLSELLAAIPAHKDPFEVVILAYVGPFFFEVRWGFFE
jgi:hypothetical protein